MILTSCQNHFINCQNSSKCVKIFQNHFKLKYLYFLILHHRYKICVVAMYYILKNPDFRKDTFPESGLLYF